jgi:hypothetical protein
LHRDLDAEAAAAKSVRQRKAALAAAVRGAVALLPLAKSLRYRQHLDQQVEAYVMRLG